MMISLFAFIIGFVLLSFFAGMEMAFVSCNKLQIRHAAEKGDKAARIITAMHERPQLFLASVLLYQNVSHVMLSSAFAFMLERIFHISDPLIDTALLSPFVVIFAEMVPKEYCRRRSNELVRRSAQFLNICFKATAPFVEYLIGLSNRVIQRIEQGQPQHSAFVTRSELLALIHESAKKGIVLDHERRLIDKIFEFEHRPVSEIMEPLSAISRILIDDSIKNLKDLARKSKSDAFWANVYENDVNNIVGIIFLFDVLFEENENASIRSFIRKPLFIRNTASNEEAFLLLQSYRQTKAIVIDKSTHAVGVITIAGLIQF